MPMIGYKCPGKHDSYVSIEGCLKACIHGERCMPWPMLKKLSQQREWTGKPSTTQLLKGTRKAYLELTENYWVNPKSRAFMLLGLSTHSLLEQFDGGEHLNEEAVSDEVSTGIMDHYDAAERTLIDYKTTGAYGVRSKLGLYPVKEPDPSGAVYARSGKGYTKGDPKQITVWRKSEAKKDCFDWEMQLNKYRIALEKMGFPVDKIKVCAIVRDFTRLTPQTAGVEEQIVMIPLRILPDAQVMAYFARKSDALVYAMENKILPDACSQHECWDGRMCADYCECNNFCDAWEKNG